MFTRAWLNALEKMPRSQVSVPGWVGGREGGKQGKGFIHGPSKRDKPKPKPVRVSLPPPSPHPPPQAIIGGLGVSFLASGVLYVGFNRGRK